VYAVALAVLLLPIAGLLISYLAETRRGIASAVVFTSWLAVLAALVLLGAVVAGGRVIHSATITFWSFQVVQTPFNAAPATLLAETFKVGVGYLANPTTAVLAVVVTLVTLLCQLQLLIQFRRDPRLGQLARLCNLLGLGALLVVLAPELFQTLLGFELCGLAAALLVGSSLGGRAGGQARSAYLVWRAGALSLLLAIGFIFVKFSGSVATAAAAAVAAAAKHKVVLPTPDSLNLTGLDQIWVAATKGLVHGVGGRTLTLAAVLVLVAAVCACGQLPGHGLGRNLGSAPGAAAGLVVALAGGVVGIALLLQTFTLLRWASGVLPAVVVLATLTSIVAAGLALREQRLRRLAVWFALSQTSWGLAGIGLGSPAAALAVLASSALGTAALFGVVSSLGRDQRVESIDQLGAAWRLTRRPVLLLLAALVAVTGVLGLGTFFGHVAVLTAAFGVGPHGAPMPPALFREIGAGGEILAMLILAAAAARVALIAMRGEESSDPRQARLVRRQLAQGRGLQQLWPSVAATALALVSGLVSLPGIGLGLGALMGPKAGVTALPFQGPALLVVLVAPLLAVALVAARRHQLAVYAVEDPGWIAWVDGTRLAISADVFGFGAPARGVEIAQSRALSPAGDAAAGAIADLVRLDPGVARSWFRWGLASSLVTVTGVALVVALVIWVVAAGHAGVGQP
jgi:NADH:ubiquinone oxidoreductase subunit 5 (subunit L)/multisubunit Na+/H+ antiporter MnhA subunit